mgnify:CR=1 FL=1
MQPDDELCLCFHVTRRKVENYLRQHELRRASQLTDCYGAGTGCGWCRPFLLRLFEIEQQRRREAGVVDGNVAANDDLPSSFEYARRRANYVRQGGGTPPPGAAPLPASDDAPQ